MSGKIGFIMLMASVSPSAQTSSVTVVRESEVPPMDPVGNCQGSGRSFDLRRLLRLENRSADVEGPNGTLRVTISGEHLSIARVDAGRPSQIYGTNIGYQADGGTDLDVELRLGYFDGQLVVFWKETYQNRIYRQGLFRMAGERVEPLCAGRGGITRVE